MADAKAQAAALKDQGNKEFTSGNYERAVELFSQAIQLDPSNHILYSNRSGAFASQKKYEEALADAEKTVELNKSFAKGYSRRGAALFGLNKLEEAAAAYKAGLQIDPSNAAMQTELQNIEEAMQQQSNPLNKLFTEEIWGKIAAHPVLKTYLHQPDFVAIVKTLIQNPMSLQMYLQDKRVQMLLGAVLGVEVRTADDTGAGAEDAMQAEPTGAARPPSPPPAKKVEPKSTQQQQQQQPPAPPAELTEDQRRRQEADREKEAGNAAYKKRDFATALQHYGRALELDPENPSVLLNVAAVEFEKEEYAQCIETCQKAYAAARAQRADFKVIARALARMGNAYVKQDNLDEAIRCYKQSLVEDRTADTLKKLTETEKLKKKRDEQAYIDPVKSAEAKKLGNEAFGVQKFPEAVQHYTEAIKRNPTDPALYSNRAAAYAKLAAFPEAIADCDKCLELDPNFVKAYTRKALAHVSMKEYHRAVDVFRKGLLVAADNTELREGLERTLMLIDQQQRSGTVDEEQRAHAMADPEIQALLTDPGMRKVLEDMQTDAQLARQHLSNPVIREKLNKLIAAGVLQVK